MQELKRLLSGKKTILAGAGLVALGAFGLWQGDASSWSTILDGSAIIFLRLAAKKIEDKVDKRTNERTDKSGARGSE